MSGPVITGRTVAPGRQRRILAPARYRHPGDVIRLIIAGLVLADRLPLPGVAVFAAACGQHVIGRAPHASRRLDDSPEPEY
jgi:hypothetical protein